ncbi:MAG: ATP-grasp domain-containing protein [Planctomycetota bacterium]
MRLYEHEAKKVFGDSGLRTPREFGVIRSPEEIDGLSPTFPVMVKSMVLTGGRGKAGGVKKAESLGQARAAASEILGKTIGGYPVEALLVEEAVDEQSAYYLGVTTDPRTYEVVVLASAEGGVDIEGVAKERPDAVLKRPVPGNDAELPADLAAEIGEFLGGPAGGLAEAASRLYAAFQDFDAKVAEINPLIVTTAGEIVAADAKMVIDDNGLYRQRRLFRLLGLAEARHDASELTRDERRARAAGFPYLDLLPEDAKKDPEKLYVGLVPGGAGYGIFSIDETANIGERFFGGRVVPVNFMDSGGGPTLERVAEMFHLLMDKEIVDLVVTSRFGGISSCDVFIRGLVECLRERHADGRRVLPVHGRMVGTDLPGARAFLEAARQETPEPLAQLEIVVGNQMIMADVIKAGVAVAFESRGWEV